MNKSTKMKYMPVTNHPTIPLSITYRLNKSVHHNPSVYQLTSHAAKHLPAFTFDTTSTHPPAYSQCSIFHQFTHRKLPSDAFVVKSTQSQLTGNAKGQFHQCENTHSRKDIIKTSLSVRCLKLKLKG